MGDNHPFDPTRFSRHDFIDRDQEKRRLLAWLRKDLDFEGEYENAYIVTGEMGIEKSMLTREVLDQLRQESSGEIAFVTVAARSVPEGFRGVLRKIGQNLQTELKELEGHLSQTTPR